MPRCGDFTYDRKAGHNARLRETGRIRPGKDYAMMRKFTLTAVFLLIAAFMLTGCGRDAFTAENYGENSITFHGKGAAKKSFVVTGSLTVEENDKIVIESAMEKGQLRIKLVTFAAQDDINASPEDLKSVTSDDAAVLDEIAEGSGTGEYTVDPGTYYVSAEVLKKMTGDVTVRVE